MSESKSINLLKAAKELNIGLATAVESLTKKGYKVEPKPSTKLTEEMYEVLLKEYQGDKIVREEARQIVIGKIRRDDAPLSTPERPEPRRGNDFEQEEILIKNTGSFIPPPAEKPEPETAPAPKESQEEGTLPGVKVVGRIDLDALKNKGRGEASEKKESKAEEPAPATIVTQQPDIVPEHEPEMKQEPLPVVEEVKPEIKPEPIVEAPEPEVVKWEEPKPAEEERVVSTPEPVNITPEEPVSKKAEPIEPVEEGDDVIRAKAQRLTGPNVIGKIDLSNQQSSRRKDQPIASSSNVAGNDHKRKRKRKEGGPQGQPGQAPSAQGQPGTRPAASGQQGTRPPAAGGTGETKSQHPGRPDFRGRKAQMGERSSGGGSKEEPTEKEIQDQIKATLARLSGAGKSGKFAQRAKFRRQKRDDVAQSAEDAALESELQSKVLKTTEFVTANELASMIDVPVTQIISTCMSLGMFVSINQRLDAETLTIVADEFGYVI